MSDKTMNMMTLQEALELINPEEANKKNQEVATKCDLDAIQTVVTEDGSSTATMDKATPMQSNDELPQTTVSYLLKPELCTPKELKIHKKKVQRKTKGLRSSGRKRRLTRVNIIDLPKMNAEPENAPTKEKVKKRGKLFKFFSKLFNRKQKK